MSSQPNLFDKDTPLDDTVYFYAEWHGTRYPIGKQEKKPLKGVLDPTKTSRVHNAPLGRTLIEVEFQPILYRDPFDPPEMGMREHLYVKARAIKNGDYLIVSDEKMKDIQEE